ncbi:hydroxyacylglutathione hydrolase [Coxiella endosymbiont of Amblyomma sculptum]|uniref:hydroxyacylglutathione hydrolase n=1 Tax=Coxiella endosymbiont of Amblyomma sculptum TaxID=2487929 RepID=UPI00132F4850|nr:hydroxyacylglutathione hydrolase [Coxiella endosymbiont of Amblyomma sculptum]QHG92478.1 hydroxyacylglutathione hydrolase [Coxiella endosymbiont of Amblyomma sculptum]
MPYMIFPIPVLNDNYVWTVAHPKNRNAIVIDPGEAEPILNAFKKRNLTLVAILLTHHHWDHTNGIADLLKRVLVSVYGPSEDAIPLCNHFLQDGSLLTLPSLDITFRVLSTPGHTLGHIVYYCDFQWVFTGDTLFTGGCGRIFEGSPRQMYYSLLKLTALPSNTRIYCGHEYTKKNLEFAQMVDPNNLKLKNRIANFQKKDNGKFPALSYSTLRLELDTNPFLRCHQADIQKSLKKHYGHSFSDTISFFAALRRWKDKF